MSVRTARSSAAKSGSSGWSMGLTVDGDAGAGRLSVWSGLESPMIELDLLPLSSTDQSTIDRSDCLFWYYDLFRETVDPDRRLTPKWAS